MKKIYSLFYHFLWITEQFFGTTRFNWTKFREAFYTKFLRPYHSKPNQWSNVEVLHVDFLDEAFIKKLPKDKPLVIKGAFNKSGSISKWSWDYLKKSLKGIEQAFTDTHRHNFNTGLMSAEDLIDNITSESPRYSILFGDIVQKRQDFVTDLETHKWIDIDSLKMQMNLTWQFFAAGKGRKTNLHGELGHAMSLQIKGTKKWTIFSPKYSGHVYPKVAWRMYLESQYHSDFAQIKNKDFGIEGYEVTLEPGDILWCPSFFWHFVENESASLSVSYKWTNWGSFIRHPFASAIILSSRHPSIIMRLPIIRHFARFHPPVG